MTASRKTLSKALNQALELVVANIVDGMSSWVQQIMAGHSGRAIPLKGTKRPQTALCAVTVGTLNTFERTAPTNMTKKTDTGYKTTSAGGTNGTRQRTNVTEETNGSRCKEMNKPQKTIWSRREGGTWAPPPLHVQHHSRERQQ
jgi:hypothetical protein